MGLIFSKCISLCLSISTFKVVLACAPVLIELASGTSLPFQLLTWHLMQFVCRPVAHRFLTAALFYPCFVTFTLCSFWSDSTFMGSCEYCLSRAPDSYFLSLKVGLGFLGQTKTVSTNYFVSRSVSRFSE